MVDIQSAKISDLSSIKELLRSVNLVIEDIEENLTDFKVLVSDQTLIGCIGLEVFGSMALLRSLAVQPNHQKKGYGLKLLNEIEEHASNLGLERLYLLTTTAEGFFKKNGYVIADRNTAPSEIAGTREFSDLCPASAIFMTKLLISEK